MGGVLFFSALALIFILCLVVMYWGLKNLYSTFKQQQDINHGDLREEIKSIKQRLDQLEKKNE